MKRHNLLNLAKYAFIALPVFLVVYIIYDKPEIIKPQNQSSVEGTTFTSVQTGNKTLRDSIVDYAMELLDTPYVTAGSGKEGFDCSGFVYFVFQHFEINVPRSSAAFEDFGREISIENIQKGDLLLFLSPTRNAIGHIGIVTNANGRQSDFIHATSGREMKVVTTSLSNEGYTRRFVKAISVL